MIRLPLRTFLVPLLLASALPLPAAQPTDAANRERIAFLESTTLRFLAGCQVAAHDGTQLFTPDGKGNYRALWTRDFAYMVEHAGDLMAPADIEAAIRYLLKGQRADGAMPDRVRPDGVAVYVAGPENHPLGEANLDNPMFMVLAVEAYLRSQPAFRQARFREWAPQLSRGLNWVPRSTAGLVFNDPAKPHSPYGFTDTVAKTGELLMESLLYWQACHALAGRYEGIGQHAKAREFRRRARAIEKSLVTLWDAASGGFYAATVDCHQLDIWGTTYTLYAGFPLGAKRRAVTNFLARNFDRFVWHGQVRHLLRGEHWARLLTPVEPERYQNGAFWATASGWLMEALAQSRPDLTQRIFTDLVADFQQGGVCECVNDGYRQLESYVVSAANPLAAGRRLFGNR